MLHDNRNFNNSNNRVSTPLLSAMQAATLPITFAQRSELDITQFGNQSVQMNGRMFKCCGAIHESLIGIRCPTV
jgi:hypothetical protein